MGAYFILREPSVSFIRRNSTYRACEVCPDEGGAVDDGIAKVGVLEVALRRIRLR